MSWGRKVVQIAEAGMKRKPRYVMPSPDEDIFAYVRALEARLTLAETHLAILIKDCSDDV